MQDDKDERAKGLIHLIHILKVVKDKPRFIFLENVPNFELSQSRLLLVTTLKELGYSFKEYLVSPIAFGIPNDRKRYYLAVCTQKSNSINTSI